MLLALPVAQAWALLRGGSWDSSSEGGSERACSTGLSRAAGLGLSLAQGVWGGLVSLHEDPGRCWLPRTPQASPPEMPPAPLLGQ